MLSQLRTLPVSSSITSRPALQPACLVRLAGACSTSGRHSSAPAWRSSSHCCRASSTAAAKPSKDAFDEIIEAGENQDALQQLGLNLDDLVTEDAPMELVAGPGFLVGEDEDEDKEEAGSSGGLPAGLPLPEQRYQQRLPFKAIKALRTQANTAAKDKTIMRITAGQSGITQNFLVACMDVLEKNELLRVKLGEGSGLERRTTAEFLEKHLDALAVHEVGYTITLYRQTGLPRPSNLPVPTARVQQQEAAAAAASRARPTASQVRAEAREKRAAAAAEREEQRKQQPKPPPEFQVVE